MRRKRRTRRASTIERSTTPSAVTKSHAVRLSVSTSFCTSSAEGTWLNTVMPPPRQTTGADRQPSATKPSPHETIHEGPTRSVNWGWSRRGKRCAVARARVTLIPIEVVGRVGRCCRSHEAVTSYLCENRCRCDRQRRGVPADDGSYVWRSNEVPLPIEQDPVGLHAETIKRPTRRESLRSRHPKLIALRR